MSNTVTAYFKGRVGVAEALYQNDYGIVMAFDGINLPAHFDCYFTAPGSDTAIPGVGADNRVAIPNAVLANSGNVVIHIPLHTGDSDSEVEYIVYFKVIGRARPEDDGTPVQMTAIERALALLQEPIGNIEEIVNEALSFTGTSFNDINNKLDNLIANSTPSQVTQLWSGTLTKEGDVATLSQSIADFDFVDVYVEYYDSDYLRKPVANGYAYFAIQSQNLEDYGANNYLQLWEKGLQISNTTATVTKNVQFLWEDFTAPPVVTPNADTGTNIVRIDGIKLVSDTIPELNDVRYGADGVTYSTAGNAVRTQLTDLKADLKADLTNETNARILLAGRVTTAEGDIDTLETHKVAQPLDEYNQPTDGTDGQLLRTKGDGSTEWVDEGLPTDEQTAAAVAAWLDEHPEATTTVQDNSITEEKLTNNLKLHVMKDYVTPQMYGAKADGVTDDTTAIQSAVNSGKNVYFPKATYVSGQINVRGNNIIIDGGCSSVFFGGNSGFIISKNSHDIEIRNFDLHCTYIKDSEADTNVNIGIVGDAEGEYFAYNIGIRNCKFDGGVMGVSASSIKNLAIENCSFGSFVYKPTDRAGGYSILLQSCINVEVSFCDFLMGAYGRHDVYVSVDQRKTDHVQCKNVLIHHCNFNHENLELDGDGHYYSEATQSINIRTSYQIIVKDCYFANVTGAVVYTTADGIVEGAIISDCIIDSPVKNLGASETKYAINYAGRATRNLSGKVDNITLINVPANYNGFAQITYASVQIDSCKIGATRITCTDGVTLQISNIITDIAYYFIRFDGSDETKGYCKDITFTALAGAKYYFASGASVSDGFVAHITKTITEEITTNGNGTVDSNTFESGQLSFAYVKVVSVQSSINSRIVLPYLYSGRYFFKVCAVEDLSKCANETQTLTITYIEP